MTELADKMDIKLHPKKSLEIASEYRGASSALYPFFSGCKVHWGGSVRIGCSVLCGLDNLSLKAIMAHEFAHIQQKHSLKNILIILILIPLLFIGFIINSFTAILITFAIEILMFSLFAWRYEYISDAIAAEYVGVENVSCMLEQVSSLINRPGDTLLHPSFKKRISRLLQG